MKYKLKDDDYLELWKYFQDKATSVKGAMFNTITWILGFAAVILGFIFTNLAKDEATNPKLTLEELMLFASLAGGVLCMYAFFALGESAKHINNNWVFAENCKNKIKGLNELLSTNISKDRENNIKIWNQLRIIVGLFSGAFLIILLYAICQILKA